MDGEGNSRELAVTGRSPLAGDALGPDATSKPKSIARVRYLQGEAAVRVAAGMR
jgi:hypothetical protein